ncbi:DUF1488 domain-containing protein [Candidatus Pantoea multigeneris]|uniref:DUF1488 domain-containing protein n=1 Tax=Candidatus Pantoea multigeneris TaxID=2608357 RepID=A0ABX0RJJ8_9GAMM|nr:DUF1488 domain-containing protein [Pantoea multigeneris]NIF24647.1 DUF1488 domain-containing protein [Pantoea multigeneris]
MNQSIQFPDREEWNSHQHAVCFPALVNGLILNCAISAAELQRRYGAGEAVTLFSLNRLDLEEEAEQAIHRDDVDDQGWVWLGSAK